jgi:hypothetical protein
MNLPVAACRHRAETGFLALRPCAVAKLLEGVFRM